MKLCIAKLAQNEIDDAVSWYESQSAGLGTRFLDELDRSIRRIMSYPFSCPEIEPDIRRCLLARFPYGIIYGADSDTIVVVAVAHLHREPRYWIHRALDENL
jgi:plasmid stabilization system protein ParE